MTPMSLMTQARKGTPTVTKEKPLLKETLSGSERTTRGKNKPGGAKDTDVGKTVITPLPDEFFSGKPRGALFRTTV